MMDLDPIRARLAAITPGPWVAGMDIEASLPGQTYWTTDVVYAVDKLPVPTYIYRPGSNASEEMSETVTRWDDHHCGGHVAETHNDSHIREDHHDANQRFIANAPTDIAALLGEVGRLQAIVAALHSCEFSDDLITATASCPECGHPIHRHRYPDKVCLECHPQ